MLFDLEIKNFHGYKISITTHGNSSYYLYKCSQNKIKGNIKYKLNNPKNIFFLKVGRYFMYSYLYYFFFRFYHRLV